MLLLNEDYEHILCITTEIKWWKEMRLNWNKAVNKEAQRVLPYYLLIAYVKNLLEYLAICDDMTIVSMKHRNAPKTIKLIQDALDIIQSVVMSDDFDDMECRMMVLRLYHDAGYSTAGQYQMRL